MEEKRYDEAITGFSYVLKLEPHNDTALKGRKDALNDIVNDAKSDFAAGKTDALMEKLALLKKIDPRNKEAQNIRDNIEKSRKQSIDKVYEQGLAFYNAGDYQKAIDVWEKVEKNDLEYKDLKELMINATITEGITDYRQGNLEIAVSLWQKTIALDPENTEAKTYLERAKARLNLRDNTTK